MVLGLVSVALMAALVMLGGRRVLRVDLELVTVVYRLAGVLGTAVVVAWMEETLFRGALQGGLRGLLGNRAAVGVGAGLYAVLHFLARVRWEAPVTWYSGFEVLGQMLAGLGEWPWVLPHLLNLLIAGLVLGLAFERSGRLYLPAGLHAGWVLGIQGFAVLTREVPGVAPWVYGTSRITDGWCALVPLLLTLAALPWVCRRTKEGMR